MKSFLISARSRLRPWCVSPWQQCSLSRRTRYSESFSWMSLASSDFEWAGQMCWEVWRWNSSFSSENWMFLDIFCRSSVRASVKHAGSKCYRTSQEGAAVSVRIDTFPIAGSLRVLILWDSGQFWSSAPALLGKIQFEGVEFQSLSILMSLEVQNNPGSHL